VINWGEYLSGVAFAAIGGAVIVAKVQPETVGDSIGLILAIASLMIAGMFFEGATR
jgi:hypothetical protein